MYFLSQLAHDGISIHVSMHCSLYENGKLMVLKQDYCFGVLKSKKKKI